MLKTIAAVALATTISGTAWADVPEVVQLVNGSNQNAADSLNTSGTFTTSFKGVNDVTINKLSGSMDSNAVDNFPSASSSSNNPTFASSFVGSAANGTGNGTAGTFALLQPTAGTSLQFDFSKPLVAGDHIFVGDVDTNEIYTISAYTFAGGVYTPVSLTAWTVNAYTGQAGQLPDGRWPTWNPTGGSAFVGTFSANTNGGGLNEPLSVLTVDQAISRVEITETQGIGTPALQFYSAASVATPPVPEPAIWAMMIGGLGLTTAAARRRKANVAVA